VGSQAILGSFASPPDSMLQSLEADIYPLRDPGAADLIDGALGDGSQFHRTFGYYAHGVGPETARAPAGWQERLVKREIAPRVGGGEPAIAWCLEPHDLVLAKCVAARQRDWAYAREALNANLVDLQTLLARAAALPVSEQIQARIKENLRAIDRELA
jgi:hypothetical protein